MSHIAKIIILPLSLLLMLASCGNSRRPAALNLQEGTPVEKKDSGKIVFDKEIHNFGTLKAGEIVAYTFIFRNKGEVPVKIVSTDKSCGCIEIKYNAEMVLPGKSSWVEVQLNTAGEWGNLIREATIKTSDGEQKELKIGAYIENKQFNNLLNTQK